ncbi:hypothetical protein GJAV_G00119790 [Gymnothorax javanicus]|nr:hypothetical protein GJAV_G00119790 [Gymnothorax javanicus]
MVQGLSTAIAVLELAPEIVKEASRGHIHGGSQWGIGAGDEGDGPAMVPFGIYLFVCLFACPSIPGDTVKLPSPQGVQTQSTNMNHLLKWRPLQVTCHPVRYSVQYQGYFELYIKNGSWEDAPGCQGINSVVCDLTPSFGSDSDYHVRVRAECEGQTSDWASSGGPFNRRETNLTAPKMKVTVSGDFVQVAFTNFSEMVGLILKHWKKGEEQEVFLHNITAERNPFHLEGPEQGATHCLSAYVTLHDRASASTETQCFKIGGVEGDGAHNPEPPEPSPDWDWLKATAACVAAMIATCTGLAAFWSARRCGPTLLNTFWPKEPLPNVLVNGEVNIKLRVPLVVGEDHEQCHPVLVLLPEPV